MTTKNMAARLRAHADAADAADTDWPLGILLHEAADEIERLQKALQSHDPVTLLKAIWERQPVYLFEAISDAHSKPAISMETKSCFLSPQKEI